jgi:CheY-like chemotaxis protein
MKEAAKGISSPELPPIEPLAPMTPLHAKVCYSCIYCAHLARRRRTATCSSSRPGPATFQRATRSAQWAALMERLLVVEHNRLLGEGLALLLQWRTGLSSTHAPSLDEAKSVLEEANQKKPACIIVDLDLPEGEGTEVLKELDGLPVLALIRSRNVERQAEAMRLGAEEVLLTTGSGEKIAAAVERLIGR